MSRGTLSDQMDHVVCLTHEAGRHTAATWLKQAFPSVPGCRAAIPAGAQYDELHQELRDTVHLAILEENYDAADWIACRPILNDTLSSEVTGRRVGLRAA
jgi:hypothetical protein